ncbi:della protein gai [Nicotiana attenuata]|uniref:Della protein gai n=1 Tax=Nicotiana attenuata TaxID=49451 RepID=A0A1J6IRI8_NICAT|nr:della protein gai [Nicotiana attenuata]
MSYRSEMSMDTTTEDGESFISNTDAIINGTSDISALAESLISGPNIPNSSWTSADDIQQQISTAGGGADDDMMIVSSGASSMLSNTNKQSEIMIFNVDFRAFAVCNNSDKIEEKGSAESSKRLESRFGLGSNIGGAVNEETSFRFVNIYTLMACAEAIQQNNLNLADALVSDIKRLAVQQSGAVKKVVYYFEDTLDRTINGMNAPYIVESS